MGLLHVMPQSLSASFSEGLISGLLTIWVSHGPRVLQYTVLHLFVCSFETWRRFCSSVPFVLTCRASTVIAEIQLSSNIAIYRRSCGSGRVGRSDAPLQTAIARISFRNMSKHWSGYDGSVTGELNRFV
jgi:hypothetical protein